MAGRRVPRLATLFQDGAHPKQTFSRLNLAISYSLLFRYDITSRVSNASIPTSSICYTDGRSRRFHVRKVIGDIHENASRKIPY